MRERRGVDVCIVGRLAILGAAGAGDYLAGARTTAGECAVALLEHQTQVAVVFTLHATHHFEGDDEQDNADAGDGKFASGSNVP